MCGFMLMINIDSFMQNMMATIIIFQDERPVFLREQANKMYYVSPYYFAKVVVDFPFTIISPILSTIILYFGVGFERTAS